MLTDQKQKVVESYSYDSFGNFKKKGSKAKNRYRFTAREFDKESGLYYYRNRYYDPKIGRFLTEDPIGFLGGVNFYGYAGNNPVNYVDPWGLCAKSEDTFWDNFKGSIYEDFTSKNPSSFLGYTIKAAQQTDILWGQVGGGVVDLVGGASIAASSAILMVKSSGFWALALYPAFVESIALAGYGIAEISSGLTGQVVPSSIEVIKDIINNLLFKRFEDRNNE